MMIKGDDDGVQMSDIICDCWCDTDDDDDDDDDNHDDEGSK